jgi:NADH dehydrogenase FAD-containing subunit
MKTVVVVGAGASGIAAAGVLNKQGAPTITSLYSLLVVFAISVTSQLTYHLI